jgi:hypothetical protein
MGFCTKCGAELIEGDKFCRGCGTPVARGETDDRFDFDASWDTYEKPKAVRETSGKCPGCGEQLLSTDKVCPTCGFQVEVVTASKAMNEFIADLSDLEARVITGELGYARVVKAIDSFSIPHTPSGILAFMALAKSRTSSGQRDYKQGDEANKAIAQAWEAKAQYAYELAKVSFSDSEEFKDIEAAHKKHYFASGVKGVVDGVSSYNQKLFGLGCLGKIIWFYLAMFVLAAVLAVLGAAIKNPSAIVVVVMLIIGAIFYIGAKKK